MKQTNNYEEELLNIKSLEYLYSLRCLQDLDILADAIKNRFKYWRW